MDAVRHIIRPVEGAWFLLLVYPDTASMRRAASRYHPEMDDDDEFWGVFHGARLGYYFPAGVEVTQEAVDAVPKEDWKWPANGYVGTMRLVKGNLTDEVLIHECLHATFRINERQWWYHHRTLPEWGQMPSEEWFCYVHGAVCKQVYEALGMTWSPLKA